MLHNLILAFSSLLLITTTTPVVASEAAVNRAPVRKPFLVPETPSLSQGQFVFQLLLGELALQRGQYLLAAGAYADLARRSNDASVSERAVEVASIAQQNDLALELARLWVEQAPELPKARHALANLLLLSDRLPELGPQLTTLLAQNPNDLAANLMSLNRLLARHNNKPQVRELVNNLTAPYLSLPEAHFARAYAALQVEKASEAEASLETALQQRPNWEIGALFLAQVLSRNNVSKAREFLGGFVNTYPEAREARLYLARLLIAEQKYTESRQQFETLLKEFPNSPDLLQPLALLALQQDDRNTAKQLLERLLTLDMVGEKADLYFFLGQLAEESKDFPDAISRYRQVQGGKYYLTARVRMASLQAQGGNMIAARATLQETVTRKGDERVQLLLAEAHILREQKQLSGALGVLVGGLERYPHNPDLLYDAALLADRLDRFKDMERWLRQLLALRPKHAHALNALGYAFAERNIRLHEAHTLLEQAHNLEPEDPFIMDSLGWVLYRQGKLDAALETAQKAYALRNDPDIAAHLIEILSVVQKKKEAEQLLREVLGEHPEHEGLQAVARKLFPKQ